MDNNIVITKEMLLNIGFDIPFNSSMIDKIYKEAYELDEFFMCTYYTDDEETPLKIDMLYQCTNNGAEWHMLIDNIRCESIGSADITYVEQFNKMMEIFNSNFRL